MDGTGMHDVDLRSDAAEIVPPVPVLELRGIHKSFGAVKALQGANLSLYRGEVTALVGENGAGKSTMVKTLAGLHQQDRGEVILNGEEISFRDPLHAREAGIAVIYQEPTMFPDLTVAENIFMGRQPLGSFRRIDRKAMRQQALELFSQLGVKIDPDRIAQGLSIADQQVVEIAKAISLDARILIMDEPTAALSGVEVQRLFTVTRTLQARGAAVLFISHRFEEVFALADWITVMRDGAHVATAAASELTVDQVIRQMVGRDVASLFPKQDAEIGDVTLEVRNLSRRGVFHDVSFTVRSGEIVGLSGLVGAGRSEVARAIFGIDKYDTGAVIVHNHPLKALSPKASMAAGIGFVPEDRRKQGLVMELNVSRNLTLTLRKRLSRFGLLSSKSEASTTNEWAKKLQIKAGSPESPISTLSGGNQQKVVLGKWLATGPKILIIDEPTRGIDVGTKSEVHRLISELAGTGLAVLMISSELPEILGMSDRVLVMHEGRITAELSRSEATEETVMTAATGVDSADKETHA
ncbi:sugar ABC transporter ATP-binding protein [Pseudarthrobacter sulfonivorans]|uniref:sugar ABC transporter ATP-binding protein n=1 Tax=Pseudarthrobacter sulfonivorans TaxID=121292 RepID=UPI002856F2F5|nr:sugar ABC transporter ATP-binding protein [Pseudarthrobacter sulfonivorans]MDR6417063.1 rhamnose transport system ATP-binding protein [Pseudarthrobacter sulfonivorans]